MNKLKTLTDRIVESLKTDANFQTYDDVLIENLVFSALILDEYKTTIKKDGIIINLTKDPNKDAQYTRHPLIPHYNDSIKNKG
jgi:hypothetical protein